MCRVRQNLVIINFTVNLDFGDLIFERSKRYEIKSDLKFKYEIFWCRKLPVIQYPVHACSVRASLW